MIATVHPRDNESAVAFSCGMDVCSISVLAGKTNNATHISVGFKFGEHIRLVTFLPGNIEIVLTVLL